ncbi:MAG: aminoacyl-tRNA hydrolase [Negativicutes bacterium]|jgi:PTH1 family peptidyl-tRNA hydrolase
MVKLIVGLGNPGKRYETTKHNVGFMAVDLLADNWGGIWKSKGNCRIAERSGVNKILLLKPQTFMNLSGEAVREVCDFYKIAREDVLVIFDDLDLPPGGLKARQSGSAGGHNGIKSIIQHLGSQEFARLKIGIGKAPAKWRGADWVLGGFDSDNWKLVEPIIRRAAAAAEYWLENGIMATMNEFNCG